MNIAVLFGICFQKYLSRQCQEPLLSHKLMIGVGIWRSNYSIKKNYANNFFSIENRLHQAEVNNYKLLVDQQGGGVKNIVSIK